MHQSTSLLRHAAPEAAGLSQARLVTCRHDKNASPLPCALESVNDVPCRETITTNRTALHCPESFELQALYEDHPKLPLVTPALFSLA